MSNLLDKKMDAFGTLAAVKTVTNAYPALDKLSAYGTVDGGLNVSIDFLLSLLNLVGVTKNDIIDFICKLLCGEKFYSNPDSKFKKVGDGMLGVIEEIVKAALLVNCKNMFTGCQVDPIIPDYLLGYVYPSAECTLFGGKGIDFNVNNLDAFGVLTNCPVDEDGSLFYFDARPTVYRDNSGSTTSYNVSTVWKSTDFNAFLWYVINKGNNNVGEHKKNVWDNRYKQIEKLKSDETFRDSFFDADYDDCKNLPTVVSSKGVRVVKTPYLICDYQEFAGNNESNVLRVTLPAERYYKTGTPWIGGAALNKTIFEFNYDYIYSLKLFDTKTLITNVVNSLVNLGGTVNINVQLEIIREKVSQLVDEVMVEESDDEYVNEGCAKTFSNELYDNLLKNAEKRHAGEIYNNNSLHIDYEKLKNKIRLIDQSENQVNIVKEVINELTDRITDYDTDANLKFSVQYDVITNFLKQTVTEIVMQLVSPKIMLLFAINQAVMGDVMSDLKALEEGTYVFSVEKILEGMINMVKEIIRKILSMLLEQLQQFLFEKLKPLLQLYTNELLLETIRTYKDLIARMMQCVVFPTAGYSGLENNVNYADIIPYQSAPKNNDC